MGEADVGLKALGDVAMASELFAVVQRDGMHHLLDRLQQAGGGIPGLGRRLPGKLADQGKARFAFHQRDERPLAVSADDGIALPVAQAAPALYHRRPLVDGNPVFELTPALPAASVALAVGFLTAQVSVKIAAGRLVSVDILVDPLGADFDSLFPAEPAGSLLWTQIESDEPLDNLPVFIGDSPGHGLPAAGISQTLGLSRSISPLAAIPADFPADRRLVPAHFHG